VTARMANREWKMEAGGWRITDGEFRIEFRDLN
jgi:hypothetical protein